MICEQLDVVVVPFPFTAREGHKRRPAVVYSKEAFNRSGHTVLAMITSSEHRPWPGETPVADLSLAALRLPCIVRLKLFTLDNRLILNRLGRLSAADSKAVEASFRSHLFGS